MVKRSQGLLKLPPPEPGKVCDDGCDCETPDKCKTSGRCERIICWDCPYAEDCKTNKAFHGCYGDAYNTSPAQHGWGCLASK